MRPTRNSLLFGLPLYCAALLGAVRLFRRGYREVVALSAGMLAVGMLTQALTVSMLRALIPYLPFICLLAAVGFAAVLSEAIALAAGVLPPSSQRIRRALELAPVAPGLA